MREMEQRLETQKPIILNGIPASPGIVIGKVCLIERDHNIPNYSINEVDVQADIDRLNNAIEKAKKTLKQTQARIISESRHDEAEIFQAHLLILEDEDVIGRVYREIKENLINAEAALINVGEGFMEVFSKAEDEYFRGKAVDIWDVVHNILSKLTGEGKFDFCPLDEEIIVLAHDLTPSDTAMMRKEKILAFATDAGSRISHTAILARSFNIPAVVGLGNITDVAQTGEQIIIDGNEGTVILNPTEEIIERYRIKQKRFLKLEQELILSKDLPTKTLDGHEVLISANIEFHEEIAKMKQHGAKGVGLYRTEYFYNSKEGLPSEEELFLEYKNVAEQVAPDYVVFRTIDIGGDKLAPHLGVSSSVSSLMGLRGIRLCLKYPSIFVTQLRAMLRASIYGDIKILFPLISGIEELWEAKEILKETKEQLSQEAIPFDPDIEIGAMIELPSAAMTADILAKEVDFFSIGTNDLIQYSLAIDRTNEKVAHLYEPFHPAVLRFIDYVVKAAHENNIWVGLCGEMAGNPVFTLILLGLGLDEFSMSYFVIPEIKQIIRSVSLEEASKFACEVMKLSTASEIEDYISEKLSKRFPELFIDMEAELKSV